MEAVFFPIIILGIIVYLTLRADSTRWPGGREQRGDRLLPYEHHSYADPGSLADHPPGYNDNSGGSCDGGGSDGGGTGGSDGGGGGGGGCGGGD